MTSKKPLEKYVSRSRSPIGYANDTNYPSGLYPNAGHGSFVLDGAGRLMFFYTYVIAYEQGFERRLGMDICDVTRQGTVSCRLSNTPRLAPGKAVSGKDDVGLYNLSTLTSAYWASSYAPGRTPYYTGDRALSTWWQPADTDTAPRVHHGICKPLLHLRCADPLEGARARVHSEERREVHASSTATSTPTRGGRWSIGVETPLHTRLTTPPSTGC